MTMRIHTPSHYFLLAAFAAVFTCSAATGAEDNPQIRRGHALATRICGRCHAVERGELHSPFEAAPPFQDIADARATTALAIRGALQSRHPVMPNVRLTEDERTDVVAYLISLKRVSVGYARPPENPSHRRILASR